MEFCHTEQVYTSSVKYIWVANRKCDNLWFFSHLFSWMMVVGLKTKNRHWRLKLIISFQHLVQRCLITKVDENVLVRLLSASERKIWSWDRCKNFNYSCAPQTNILGGESETSLLIVITDKLQKFLSLFLWDIFTKPGCRIIQSIA